jgi:hypothetical protein
MKPPGKSRNSKHIKDIVFYSIQYDSSNDKIDNVP